MNQDSDKLMQSEGGQSSRPEKIELDYVARKYNVSLERAKELVAQFGDDESLIAAELALKDV